EGGHDAAAAFELLKGGAAGEVEFVALHNVLLVLDGIPAILVKAESTPVRAGFQMETVAGQNGKAGSTVETTDSTSLEMVFHGSKVGLSPCGMDSAVVEAEAHGNKVKWFPCAVASTVCGVASAIAGAETHGDKVSLSPAGAVTATCGMILHGDNSSLLPCSAASATAGITPQLAGDAPQSYGLVPAYSFSTFTASAAASTAARGNRPR
ncbi:MAG: hypothetical protein HZA89_15430, partial [Verrucomicrobia bacterium]|nr:hypothetical protein [Verrucomicrobiota bacterium]